HRARRERVALEGGDRRHGQEHEPGEQGAELLEQHLAFARVAPDPLGIEAVAPELAGGDRHERTGLRGGFRLVEQAMEGGENVAVDADLAVTEGDDAHDPLDGEPPAPRRAVCGMRVWGRAPASSRRTTAPTSSGDTGG